MAGNQIGPAQYDQPTLLVGASAVLYAPGTLNPLHPRRPGGIEFPSAALFSSRAVEGRGERGGPSLLLRSLGTLFQSREKHHVQIL